MPLNHFFHFVSLHLFQRVIHHGAHLAYTESIYDLDRIALFHDSGGACGFQGGFIYQLDILYLHPEKQFSRDRILSLPPSAPAVLMKPVRAEIPFATVGHT